MLPKHQTLEETSICQKAAEDWTDPEIEEAIGKITSQFQLFECHTCAETVQRWLIQNGIPGQKLQQKLHEEHHRLAECSVIAP
jgi:predicted metal-binding protein